MKPCAKRSARVNGPVTDRFLKIGKIPYTNLFPLFYMLERESDSRAYTFVEGFPSALNSLLRRGELDISPSSSIEFLRHREGYRLIEGHSVSALGPIGSILLFSRRPIETLDGFTLLTSSQSETSVALLGIILSKFYELDCTLQSSNEPLNKAIASHPAYLLIGDDALREALAWPNLFIYDLGDIWYKQTGLPFVFALWIARKDRYEESPHLFGVFAQELDRAKDAALTRLPAIADASPLNSILSREELIAYWQNISYDFTDRHREGLDLFRRYAEELKLV